MLLIGRLALQRGRDQVDLVATAASASVARQLRDVTSTTDVSAASIARRLLRAAEDVQNVSAAFRVSRIDDAKCIVVTRVCVFVCLSVRGRTSMSVSMSIAIFRVAQIESTKACTVRTKMS